MPAQRTLSQVTKELEAQKKKNEMLSAQNEKLTGKVVKLKKKAEADSSKSKSTTPEPPRRIVPKPRGVPGRSTTKGSGDYERHGYNIEEEMDLDTPNPHRTYLDFRQFVRDGLNRQQYPTLAAFGSMRASALKVNALAKWPWMNEYPDCWPVDSVLVTIYDNAAGSERKKGNTRRVLNKSTRARAASAKRQAVEVESSEDSSDEERADRGAADNNDDDSDDGNENSDTGDDRPAADDDAEVADGGETNGNALAVEDEENTVGTGGEITYSVEDLIAQARRRGFKVVPSRDDEVEQPPSKKRKTTHQPSRASTSTTRELRPSTQAKRK